MVISGLYTQSDLFAKLVHPLRAFYFICVLLTLSLIGSLRHPLDGSKYRKVADKHKVNTQKIRLNIIQKLIEGGLALICSM